MMMTSRTQHVNQPPRAAPPSQQQLEEDDGNQNNNEMLHDDSSSTDTIIMMHDNNDDYFDPLEDTIHEETLLAAASFADGSILGNGDADASVGGEGEAAAGAAQQLFQLLNLPPSLDNNNNHHANANNGANNNNNVVVVGYPVGGMRRVSSCYFSIASEISMNNSHAAAANANATTNGANANATANAANNGNGGGSGEISPNSLFYFDISMHRDTSIHSQLDMLSLSNNNNNIATTATTAAFNNINNNNATSNASATNFPHELHGQSTTISLLPPLLPPPPTTSSTTTTLPINVLYQHDILMNTLIYLDYTTLVSLSETNKKLNYECFYFLELQLQRALLCGNNGVVGDDDDGGDGGDNEGVHDNEQQQQHQYQEQSYNEYSMIAGTGIITRLSHLNNTHARQIVQTYLDSNTSIRGMPMMHSLSYLRQMIRLHYSNNNSSGGGGGTGSGGEGNGVELRQQQQQQEEEGVERQGVQTTITAHQQQQQQQDGMISTARNMALLLTFLGAAYRYQHGGEVPNMNELVDEETMEVAKNMMIRLGLAGSAGSFFKFMKEHHDHQQQRQHQGMGEGEGGQSQGEGGEDNGASERVEEVVGGRQEEDNTLGDEGEQQQEEEGQQVGETEQQDEDLQQQQQEEMPEEEVLQQQQQELMLQQHQQHQEGMAAKARNVALLLTLLGAAYKVNAGEIHIDEETVEVAKNMAIKLGLAGSLVKAGQMTINKKERGEHSDSDGESGERNGLIDSNSTGRLGEDAQPRHRTDRSSSMGSIEDLSNMIKHPGQIASRLYNAFHSPNSSTTNLDSVVGRSGSSRNIESMNSGAGTQEATPRRKHRSKRSHSALRVNELESREEEKDVAMDDSVEMKKSPAAPNNNKSNLEPPTPEAVNYAMDHPFSANPYDHISADQQKKCANDASVQAMTSFLPFNMGQQLAAITATDNVNSPTGCIGAYARAVKSAASEVTRLLKEQRKANFDSLPEDEQMELGIRFIDACSSDEKIDIVKDILQKQKMMDVDRFFIGPDETETCALHAAAFNGAEKVLEFLCGGIDENDPNKDCGLCDVNVKDANGWTALHFAAGANSVLSVRILAEHGANLTIEASNGYTPYHWAERLSNEEVAAELGSFGADNRFVGGWVLFGGSSLSSFLAKRFFAFRS